MFFSPAGEVKNLIFSLRLITSYNELYSLIWERFLESKVFFIVKILYWEDVILTIYCVIMWLTVILPNLTEIHKVLCLYTIMDMFIRGRKKWKLFKI